MKRILLLSLLFGAIAAQDTLRVLSDEFIGEVIGIDSSKITFLEMGKTHTSLIPVYVLTEAILADGTIIVQNNQLKVGHENPLWDSAVKLQHRPAGGNRDILRQYQTFLTQSDKTLILGALYGPKFSLEKKWESWDGSESSVTKRRFSGEYIGLGLERGKVRQAIIISTFSDYFRHDEFDPEGYDRYGPNNDERQESIQCLQLSSTYLANWYEIGLSLNLYMRSYEHIYEKNYMYGGIVHEEGHIVTKNKVKFVPGLYLRVGKERLFIETGGANSRMFRPDLTHIHLNIGSKLPGIDQSVVKVGMIEKVSSLHKSSGLSDIFGSVMLSIHSKWYLEGTIYRDLGTWGDKSSGMDGIQIGLKYKCS